MNFRRRLLDWNACAMGWVACCPTGSEMHGESRSSLPIPLLTTWLCWRQGGHTGDCGWEGGLIIYAGFGCMSSTATIANNSRMNKKAAHKPPLLTSHFLAHRDSFSTILLCHLRRSSIPRSSPDPSVDRLLATSPLSRNRKRTRSLLQFI